MSFARFALRTCAFHAIREAQTLVGANVRDSEINALDVTADGSLRTDEDRPFIVLYTDDGTAKEADLRDLRQNGLVDFVVEFGVASPMTAHDEATGESKIIGLNVPATDAAFEMTLDLVDRQVVAALTAPGPWAELWRRLSSSVTQIQRKRAASADDGTRIAARQLRIRLEVIPDPVWGQPLAAASVWQAFVDAITTEDPDLGAVATAFLGPVATSVTADLIRRSRGHTEPEARALRYGSLYPGGVAWTIQAAQVAETVGG